MSEAPDELNEKIVRFAKQLMLIICEVYGCERVYLCTMCDGPANHYHVQLIPRYKNEKRGSENFTKKRMDYVFDKGKLDSLKEKINAFAKSKSK
jgi:diadenosine tetraphosphate (Ap4A) HIT family hydrolase